MSLLKQDTIKKKRVDKNNVAELDAGNKSGKYKIEAIWDSAFYIKELESGYFSRLNYQVFWKDYLEEKNTWKPYLAVQYFRKLINLFYKNHLNKPIIISKAINNAPPMAKPTIKPAAKLMAPKQKQS